MEEWFIEIFNLLPGGALFVVAVFFVAFLEALVGIGLVMPGSVLTVFSGWLAFQGKTPVLAVMTAAGSGAFLGDLVSYFLGARYGIHLWQWNFLKKRSGLLRLTELFFIEHGGKSVFLGRFLGPIRGLVPFVAGASQMKPATFTGFTILSGILWGISYPGIGFLGGASWEEAETLAARLGLLLGLAIIVSVSAVWLRHKFLPQHELRKAREKKSGED